MSNNGDGSKAPKPDTEFKKPIMIDRMGNLAKKIKTEPEEPVESSSQVMPKKRATLKALPKSMVRDYIPIPYKEPKWSGLCPIGSKYGLEILKAGVIVNKVDLMQKPYYVFGRFTNCDVILIHVTISRHHAVLQYKAFAGPDEPSTGWYLYDVGSTHGTFLNKEKIKEKHYIRIKVGHQIKFGTSTKTFILVGPESDAEGESELTVTEIKEQAENIKKEKEKMIQEGIEQKEKDKQEEEKKKEEQGIDWGMGEDAEAEPDLTENPYASTANEELYLDDPKKTLRGYFEREGHELTYNCEERGVGQYICRVELPMDDARGKPVLAEVIHRGKKKEAVVACALEACKILDRAGLLRQATHESRRRKERDWSADDFYDSDEDTFLDRTGNVEKKRQARMEKHGVVQAEADKPLTYDDLVKQISELESKIELEEKYLKQLRSTRQQIKEANNKDDLDEYMKSLGQQGQSIAEKAEISKTKMDIKKLTAELSKTQRLAELARPAHLPPIIKKVDIKNYDVKDDTKKTVKQTNSVVYGKRLKLKEDLEKKPKDIKERKQEDAVFVEEMDSDEEAGPSNDKKVDEKGSKDEKVDEAGSKDKKVDKEGFKEEKVDEKESKDDNVGEENTKDEKVAEEESKDDKVDEEKSKDEKVAEEESKNKKESVLENDNEAEKDKDKKVYGPMMPPENYVAPEGYFEQETDRDLPEIEEKE